jgi:AraC-like DNA-binding protein
MPDKLIPTLMQRFGFSASNFFAGNFCGNNTFHADNGLGHLHLVRHGPLILEHEDGSAFTVDQPACVVYPQPLTHRLVVPPGATAQLICATLEFKEPVHNPFVLALPPRMVVPLDAASGLREVIELLSHETEDGKLGQAFVVDRLCEILVCQLIRHAERSGLLKAGVLAGFSDSGIARALAAVHEEPATDWRVDSLAAVAGLSRSAFAARFRELVGTSPASYVANWRLSLAETLLARGQSVKAVARAVGYGTQQSFTRAFIDKHGVPPTQWLAARGQAA